MSTAFCTTTSKRFYKACFWAALIAACCGVSFTQSTRNAAERLNEVVNLTSLRSVDKPWHLKLEVTVLDEAAVPREGTVESWRDGEESRTIVTFPGGVTTNYDHAKEHYHSQQGNPAPPLVFEVLGAVLHPGPDSGQVKSATPELRTHTFGKAKYDCVMLSRHLEYQPSRQPAETPLGLFPTFCMEPQSDHLEVIFSYGNPTIFRTSLGKFLDREITTGVIISLDSTTLARGKVVALSTFDPSKEDIAPPADLKPVGTNIPSIAAGLIKGTKTGDKAPEYPVSARRDHVSGSVVLHAIIGVDGHIEHLTVMSAPSADLAVSALRAVRAWTYKPYLLNGEPTEVDTTITVNYNLSG